MLSTRKSASMLAFIVITGLVVVKALVAFLTGSISITAQAVDSFLDLFAVGVTMFAVRAADEPADEQHPFGHGKIEGIAAAVQALLIFIAGGWIIYSAIERIVTGAELEMSEAGIAVMVVSIVASVLLSRHLLRVARASDSLALDATARNINADIYSATGVLVTMVVIRFTGFSVLDPVVGVGVSLIILWSGYKVLKIACGELVDNRLPEEEENVIVSCIEEHTTQLAGYHKVRTRKAGTQRFVDFHLLLPKDMPLEEAHAMADHIEQDIKDRLAGTSVTIHLEPCEGDCDNCRISSCNLRSASDRPD